MKYELNTVESEPVLTVRELEYGKLYKIVECVVPRYVGNIITPCEHRHTLFCVWPTLDTWSNYLNLHDSYGFRLLPPGTTVTLTQE